MEGCLCIIGVSSYSPASYSLDQTSRLYPLVVLHRRYYTKLNHPWENIDITYNLRLILKRLKTENTRYSGLFPSFFSSLYFLLHLVPSCHLPFPVFFLFFFFLFFSWFGDSHIMLFRDHLKNKDRCIKGIWYRVKIYKWILWFSSSPKIISNTLVGLSLFSQQFTMFRNLTSLLCNTGRVRN